MEYGKKQEERQERVMYLNFQEKKTCASNKTNQRQCRQMEGALNRETEPQSYEGIVYSFW
jgi:hypothetical protein